MVELFPHVLLLALMSSTLANFWTLCLVRGMIFGGLGDKIRSQVDYAKHRDNGLYGWNKLLKGFLCPYCTAIWIIVTIHTLYFHVLEPGSIGFGYSIFALFFGIGLTTLFNKITGVFINQNLEL